MTPTRLRLLPPNAAGVRTQAATGFLSHPRRASAGAGDGGDLRRRGGAVRAAGGGGGGGDRRPALCRPIWVAVMIGVVIVWSWRPRWTSLVFQGLRSRLRILWTTAAAPVPPWFGAHRLWLALTALSAFSVCGRLWSSFSGKSASAAAGNVAGGGGRDDGLTGDSSEVGEDNVTEKDLERLLHLLGGLGDSAWQLMMDHSTPNLAYQAWRYEPEAGPVIYRSRTVFEDATPELARDFFWDDDFRPKWDPMLSYFKTLEECPVTGEMIVHWIKKFPFFCSDRENIMGRRIWESSETFYCVTKGVPYPGLAKHDKPRLVELYYSSWRIRPVESRKGDGQLSACEVILVHYEDMGIPKDVAKVGLRHGMWGAVKKLHSGMRAYQLARKSDASSSRCALMARITTKLPLNNAMISLDPELVPSEDKVEPLNLNKMDQSAHWKWLVLGATVAVVCGLQTGVIGKALMFGAARKYGRS